MGRVVGAQHQGRAQQQGLVTIRLGGQHGIQKLAGFPAFALVSIEPRQADLGDLAGRAFRRARDGRLQGSRRLVGVAGAEQRIGPHQVEPGILGVRRDRGLQLGVGGCRAAPAVQKSDQGQAHVGFVGRELHPLAQHALALIDTSRLRFQLGKGQPVAGRGRLLLDEARVDRDRVVLLVLSQKRRSSQAHEVRVIRVLLQPGVDQFDRPVVVLGHERVGGENRRRHRLTRGPAECGLCVGARLVPHVLALLDRSAERKGVGIVRVRAKRAVDPTQSGIVLLGVDQDLDDLELCPEVVGVGDSCPGIFLEGRLLVAEPFLDLGRKVVGVAATGVALQGALHLHQRLRIILLGVKVLGCLEMCRGVSRRDLLLAPGQREERHHRDENWTLAHDLFRKRQSNIAQLGGFFGFQCKRLRHERLNFSNHRLDLTSRHGRDETAARAPQTARGSAPDIHIRGSRSPAAGWCR